MGGWGEGRGRPWCGRCGNGLGAHEAHVLAFCATEGPLRIASRDAAAPQKGLRGTEVQPTSDQESVAHRAVERGRSYSGAEAAQESPAFWEERERSAAGHRAVEKDSAIAYSAAVEPTYENFVAGCPHCGANNIFNRASDLRTFQPIRLRTVPCQGCDRPFKINKDSADAAHQMLLSACYTFIERKQYMQCVLGVAQAYEVFFGHFLYVQLIYRAFAKDSSHDLRCLSHLKNQLYERVQQFTFEPMRRLFLRLVVDGVAPASLADAKAAIDALPKKKVSFVPRQSIEAVPDDRLKALLLLLQDAEANKLRNQVVHKDAYRPKLDEAKRVHEEALQILGGLTVHLRLGYDASWYMGEPGR